MKKIFSHVNETILLQLLVAALACLWMSVFFACKMPSPVSIKKDLNTGLVTKTSALKTEESMLVMNNEIIHHTDIPLGESFVLVNDKVSGLKVKNGKVSTGCSLEISDSAGNILLKENDLFAGRDVFEEKDGNVLKCTISTGQPMKYDESYTAKVRFWDKYGEGNIENELHFNIIDIP